MGEIGQKRQRYTTVKSAEQDWGVSALFALRDSRERYEVTIL